MNGFPLFILFFIFNLNAKQTVIKATQKISQQANPIVSQKNPSVSNQATVPSTDGKIKVNTEKTPVSKIKLPQKSNNNLNGKKISSPSESDVKQETLSPTDNTEKEISSSPIDNIETESAAQSVQSIDNKTLIPIESNEKSSATKEDNKGDIFFPQIVSHKKKESPPLESNENIESSVEKPPFSIELETEGILIKNLLSKNQKGFYPHIPSLDLSFEYNILSYLKFFTELGFSSKKNKNLWNTKVEQVGLFYRSNILNIKAGLIPISLGYSYFNSKIFVHPLKFYRPFITNPMDTGLRLTVPLYKEYLTFAVSRFKGYSKRVFDNYYKSPEFAPLTVNLKSKGPSWNGFITYLKQDLAFKEPLSALGGGFIFKTSISKESIISLQGEVWGSGERLQSSFSYYFFPKLSLNKYELIVLFGEIKNFVPNFKTSENTSSIYKWILQGSYELFPGVFLIGERSIAKQKKGPLIGNLWALRLKTKIEF